MRDYFLLAPFHFTRLERPGAIGSILHRAVQPAYFRLVVERVREEILDRFAPDFFRYEFVIRVNAQNKMVHYTSLSAQRVHS